MLKNIIITLKEGKNVRGSMSRFAPAKVFFEPGVHSPENSLVITNDMEKLDTALNDGYAVVFLSDSESFAEGVKYVAQELDDCDYEYCNEAFCRQKGLPLLVFETERTTVREITVEDLPELYELYDDESIRKYVEPLYDYNKEKEFTENYIMNMYAFYGFGLWIVRDKKNGRIIGRTGLEIRSIDGEERLELGYIIAKEYRRQGYAFEVCRAVLEYAFDRLEAKEVFIIVQSANLPSIRLAEKLGAKCAGFSEFKNGIYMIFQCKE